MCGRFVSSSSPDKIAEFFNASFETEPLAENFNVAPTNDVYGLVADHLGQRRVQAFRWGLVPSWAADVKIGSSLINARAETIAEKPAFRSAVRKHRLLIPMDGFYEWKRTGSAKQPMFIHRTDGQPLAVAGVWAAWRDPAAPADAGWLHSCSVITTAANDTRRPVHDRMPVILPRSAWDAWLDPENHDVEALRSMLRAAPNTLLTMHAVATTVNNVRNKGPELVEPFAERLDLGDA